MKENAELPRWYIVPTKLLFLLTRLPVRLLFRVFTRLEINGVENIKSLKPGVIIAANHTSELDPILLTFIFPFRSKLLPLFFVSMKKGLYSNMSFIKNLLYGGWFFKFWGAYPAILGAKNYELSLQNHILLLDDNRSVCIFPEGGRSKDGTIREAKGGVGYLSYRTNKPVVPVAIRGAINTSFWKFISFQRKIEINIGKPMYPSDLFIDPKNIIISFEYDDCRIAAASVVREISKLYV